MSDAIMNVLCRGLVGYVSYLATCSASEVYSEYLLYEPILRIAQSKGFSVQCEKPVVLAEGPGDHRRIDFDLLKKEEEKRIGIEVKWVDERPVSLENDIEKLVIFRNNVEEKGYDVATYLLLFGRPDHVLNIIERKLFGYNRGKMVSWNSGKTNYGCTWVSIEPREATRP